MIERNKTIDALKVIGILLILFAHIRAPVGIFQIRTFDVPMMVFLSGCSFLVAGKNNVKFIPYLFSRFIRLLLPVWIFLTCYFIFIYLFDIEYMQKYLNLEKIISSFTLYEGFGYVWIIRVFLLVAILTPVYLFVINKFGEYVSFFIFLLSVIFLSFLGEKNLINYKSFTITDIIIPAISYGLMFITGYCCVRSTNKKMLFFILVISAFLFSLTCYYNGFHPQSWKYPPLSQYIFYAITISVILYKTVDFIYNKINSNSAILTFIASNTMWIYLWHIPIVEHVIKTRMFNDYLIRWAFVSIVTISVVAVQYLMVKFILKYVNNKKISSVIKKVFTG